MKANEIETLLNQQGAFTDFTLNYAKFEIAENTVLISPTFDKMECYLFQSLVLQTVFGMIVNYVKDTLNCKPKRIQESYIFIVKQEGEQNEK